MEQNNFNNRSALKIPEFKKLISNKKNIIILCHRYPDGDAIGSSIALATALSQLGKNVKVLCNDVFPAKYSYITDNFKNATFDNPDFIISVDIADTQLLGDKLLIYKDKVNVSIDHHASRSSFAELDIVFPQAAANCEILYYFILNLGLELTPFIANCLYTGIATDTGCFKYSNVTDTTHIVTAHLIRCGADIYTINKIMFDTKSLAKIKLEQYVLSSLKLFCDGKCAVVTLLNDMLVKTGMENDDVEGISSIPGRIDGVLIGITFREKENHTFKISVRTQGDISACDICATFGGGGHKNAAGCQLSGNLDEIILKIVSTAEKFLPGS